MEEEAGEFISEPEWDLAASAVQADLGDLEAVEAAADLADSAAVAEVLAAAAQAEAGKVPNF